MGYTERLRVLSKFPCLKQISPRQQSGKEGKDQESIQSRTTTDPGYQWESDIPQLDITNESQEVSPFPSGDYKASINRQVK